MIRTASCVQVWIRDRRWRALCPNGNAFGIDRYGNTYAWTPDPGGDNGRKVTLEDCPERVRASIIRRGSLDQAPALTPVREVLPKRDRRGIVHAV